MQITQLFDTLKSLAGGLGGQKDKSANLRFNLRLISADELNAMHRSDWLARKIVDIIPNDMTREWRDWQAEAKQIEAIEAVENAPLIQARRKANEALRKARLYGGSVIYLGMADETPDKPLDVERVQAGDLRYLHVLHRHELGAGEIIRDVTSEFYGQPAYYEVTGRDRMVRVHPSRMIRFVGAQILDDRVTDSQGWGDSVLQVSYDAVSNAASSQQHVAALIPEAKSDVIYIPGLSKYLQNEQSTEQLTNRFAYANQIKSMFNMLLLEGDGKEAGEKWEQKQISFGELTELLRQYLQVAAGAADIPVTRLLGESPAGLNATGDSDLRNYYDNIGARQTNELQPNLHRLDEVLIRSALGNRPDEIYYDWASLWTPSEKERAEIFKTKSDAARALAGNGQSPSIMPIEALSDSLVNAFIEDGSLPGLDQAIQEYGGLAENQPSEEDRQAAVTPTPEDPATTEE